MWSESRIKNPFVRFSLLEYIFADMKNSYYLGIMKSLDDVIRKSVQQSVWLPTGGQDSGIVADCGLDCRLKIFG